MTQESLAHYKDTLAKIDAGQTVDMACPSDALRVPQEEVRNARRASMPPRDVRGSEGTAPIRRKPTTLG